MSFIWPAKHQGKISRVPVHASKTRSDCPFEGLGVGERERVFPDCSFPFVRVDLIASIAELLDEENSPLTSSA